MPQVDFYVIDSDQTSARDEFVCKLVGKLFKLNKKVVISFASEDLLNRFNHLLWEFPPEAFIPHCVLDSTQPSLPEKILLTTNPTLCDSIEVLINLTNTPPDNHGTIERLVEVVVQLPNVLNSTRNNFRFYRDCGYPIQSHDISR